MKTIDEEFKLYQAFITNNPTARVMDVYTEDELHRHYRVGNKFFVAECRRGDGCFIGFHEYLTLH